ncbi:MAG: hypothetical protein IPG67_18710 [Acidobacteria bacterium]|nr:hypothetical protein [Acidobacteriota bacterium]
MVKMYSLFRDADDLASDVILKTTLSLAKAICVRESCKGNAEAAEVRSDRYRDTPGSRKRLSVLTTCGVGQKL